MLVTSKEAQGVRAKHVGPGGPRQRLRVGSREEMNHVFEARGLISFLIFIYVIYLFSLFFLPASGLSCSTRDIG